MRADEVVLTTHQCVQDRQGNPCSDATLRDLPLEQAAVILGGRLQAEVVERPPGRGASARRALDQTLLEQIRLVDVLDRVLLLSHRDGERRETDRTAAELLADRPQDLAVEPVQPGAVDLERVERLGRPLLASRRRRGGPARSRGPSAAGGWRPAAFRGCGGRSPPRRHLDRRPPAAGRAAHDQRQIARAVVLEAVLDPEAVAQRRGEQARRVVAPISVNGGSGSVTIRAPAPWPTVIGSTWSSIAG